MIEDVLRHGTDTHRASLVGFAFAHMLDFAFTDQSGEGRSTHRPGFAQPP
ncbi:hypothetical protein [Streptomyces sp. NPDC048669]